MNFVLFIFIIMLLKMDLNKFKLFNFLERQAWHFIMVNIASWSSSQTAKKESSLYRLVCQKRNTRLDLFLRQKNLDLFRPFFHSYVLFLVAMFLLNTWFDKLLYFKLRLDFYPYILMLSVVSLLATILIYLIFPSLISHYTKVIIGW